VRNPTRHTIEAQPHVKFRVPGLEDLESADPLIEVEYTYLPGYPATGPTYYSGGEPGQGPELDLISAKLLAGDGLDPDQKQVEEWARDWLDDAGYDIACRHAEDGQGPDPDAWLDAKRDDAR
jgi:hypothetical protein